MSSEQPITMPVLPAVPVVLGAPITRGMIVSWGKVAAMVLPLLVAVLTATWRLSADAAEARRDAGDVRREVDSLSAQVKRNTSIVDLHEGRWAAVMATGNDMGEIKSILVQVRLGQTEMSAKWAAIEQRLTRIENKQDKRP